ncbi:MAG: class I SAM-dependent methyltransferase [Actinomycetota bacterium]|nr:class I SAM-dependent methyltransferase [Actinomycetota bacterium]
MTPDALARIFADPPPVHSHQRDAPRGVWATATDCCEFIADVLRDGDRTLETGCGLSTAVFALGGAHHTSVFLNESEGEIFRRWSAEKGISIDRVTLLAGGSDKVLPNLDMGDLDVVFIDGGHAYPLAILDWFYAGAALKRGGTLVVDDAGIPGVQRLIEFLDHDHRWINVVHNSRWAAYRRLSSGSLAEEWVDQPFLPPTQSDDVRRVARTRKAAQGLAAAVQRARHRARSLVGR